MQSFAKFLPLLALSAVISGCASTSVTNLTPRQEQRNPNGLYSIEALWNSSQQNIRKDSIKPKVVIGLEEFPMHQTLMLSNRWEALIPVPADKNLVHYHFKFDFNYTDFNGIKPDSRLSGPYQLEIQDK